MPDIIKVYREELPPLRFIGKKYCDLSHWHEWFSNGWFDTIETAMGGTDVIKSIWMDGGGYVGLERRRAGYPFEYYIGMFTPAETEVPEGFAYVDFPSSNIGVCWIYGDPDLVHGVSGCCDRLVANKIEVKTDENGAIWSFENCLCPRFTTPDDAGNIILDYCYFVE